MNNERPLKGVSMDNILDELKLRGADVFYSSEDDGIILADEVTHDGKYRCGKAIVVVIRW